MFPVAGRRRRPRWLAVGVVYGPQATRDALRGEVDAATATLGRSVWFDTEPADVDAGFPPWRLGIEGMTMLDDRSIDMNLARRLKAWMDPDAILAPGRYVWPPER